MCFDGDQVEDAGLGVRGNRYPHADNLPGANAQCQSERICGNQFSPAVWIINDGDDEGFGGIAGVGEDVGEGDDGAGQFGARDGRGKEQARQGLHRRADGSPVEGCGRANLRGDGDLRLANIVGQGGGRDGDAGSYVDRFAGSQEYRRGAGNGPQIIGAGKVIGVVEGAIVADGVGIDGRCPAIHIHILRSRQNADLPKIRVILICAYFVKGGRAIVGIGAHLSVDIRRNPGRRGRTADVQQRAVAAEVQIIRRQINEIGVAADRIGEGNCGVENIVEDVVVAASDAACGSRIIVVDAIHAAASIKRDNGVMNLYLARPFQVYACAVVVGDVADNGIVP